MMPRMSRGRGMVFSCSPAMRAGGLRQHQRAVAQRDRLGDVMGDEDDGLAPEVPKPEQVVLQLHARLRVERAERLVHQDDRRIVDERADEGGALAHAAGELVRIVVLEAGKADRADQHLGARSGLVVESALHREREQHVLQRRAPGQQVVLLRDVADLAGEPRVERLGIVDGRRLRTESAPRRRWPRRSGRAC